MAPWINLNTDNLDEGEDEIAKPWLEMPINYSKIKNHSDKLVAIFSDNDFYVPLSDKDIFEKKLNAKIIIESGKGHFTSDDGIIELPSALNAITDISK